MKLKMIFKKKRTFLEKRLSQKKGAKRYRIKIEINLFLTNYVNKKEYNKIIN